MFIHQMTRFPSRFRANAVVAAGRYAEQVTRLTAAGAVDYAAAKQERLDKIKAQAERILPLIKQVKEAYAQAYVGGQFKPYVKLPIGTPVFASIKVDRWASARLRLGIVVSAPDSSGYMVDFRFYDPDRDEKHIKGKAQYVAMGYPYPYLRRVQRDNMRAQLNGSYRNLDELLSLYERSMMAIVEGTRTEAPSYSERFDTLFGVSSSSEWIPRVPEQPNKNAHRVQKLREELTLHRLNLKLGMGPRELSFDSKERRKTRRANQAIAWANGLKEVDSVITQDGNLRQPYYEFNGVTYYDVPTIPVAMADKAMIQCRSMNLPARFRDKLRRFIVESFNARHTKRLLAVGRQRLLHANGNPVNVLDTSVGVSLSTWDGAVGMYLPNVETVTLVDGRTVVMNHPVCQWDDGTWHTAPEPVAIGGYHSGKGVVGFVPDTSYGDKQARPENSRKGVYLGVEWELELDCDVSTSDRQRVKLARAIKQHLQTGMQESYALRYAHCENDGSLEYNGFEVVTGYTTLGMHEQQFKNLFDQNGIKTKGLATSSRTGIHVHVSKGDTDIVHCAKMRNFLSARKTKVLVDAVARRSPNNYCKRDNAPELKNTARYLRERKNYGYDRKNAYKNTRDTSHDRYEALNTCNTKTYEVRIFASSLSYTDIMSCLEFTWAMYWFCKESPWTQITTEAFLEYIQQPRNRAETLNLRKVLKAKGFDVFIGKPVKAQFVPARAA